MKNPNWLADIIKGLFSFIKEVFIKPPEVKPVLTPPPVPTPAPITEVPTPITPGMKLYNTAKDCLGMDASPNDVAPDEFGCAETINEIHKKAFGFHIVNPGLSTMQIYKAMLAQPQLFQKVSTHLPGDIIISPTGLGNGRIPNGHVGIVGKYGILSNDSATGKFKENYTLGTWMTRYQFQGGYPVVFFRRI